MLDSQSFVHRLVCNCMADHKVVNFEVEERLVMVAEDYKLVENLVVEECSIDFEKEKT